MHSCIMQEPQHGMRAVALNSAASHVRHPCMCRLQRWRPWRRSARRRMPWQLLWLRSVHACWHKPSTCGHTSRPTCWWRGPSCRRYSLPACTSSPGSCAHVSQAQGEAGGSWVVVNAPLGVRWIIQYTSIFRCQDTQHLPCVLSGSHVTGRVWYSRRSQLIRYRAAFWDGTGMLE